ncbi:hypothetical protein OS493_027723 [Desmophyllum pertusum]|uniref:Uncharacterized protein n=1 Tax=Desmophyllum pertusum TaxID=174260 RepID=A0A9W9ZA44_9CNID|nr:hypothetical protein OS493_027723 [Desmophyllum pertusum]
MTNHCRLIKSQDPRGRFATAVQFYRQSDGFTKIHKLAQQLFKDYGPIYKENVSDKTPVVHIMEPADIETVFRAEGKYPHRPPLDGMIKHREKKGQFLGFENISGLKNGREYVRLWPLN